MFFTTINRFAKLRQTHILQEAKDGSCSHSKIQSDPPRTLWLINESCNSNFPRDLIFFFLIFQLFSTVLGKSPIASIQKCTYASIS